MTIPAAPETPGYEPTQAQLERAAAMRRFNWLYMYTPVIIGSLILLVLIGLLLWGVFSGKVTGTREFASGLADIIMILTIMPLLLLCAIPSGLAVGYMVYRRQNRASRAEHGRLQRLLWKIDHLVERVHQRLETGASRAAGPLVSAHAWATYWQTLFTRLRRIIKWN